MTGVRHRWLGLSEIEPGVVLLAYDRTEGVSTNSNMTVGDMTDAWVPMLSLLTRA